MDKTEKDRKKRKLIRQAEDKALCLFAFLIFFILICLFLSCFFSAIFPQNNFLILKKKSVWSFLLYSTEESFLSTLLALILAFPFSFFISKRSFPGKKVLQSFSAIPLSLPALVISLGFISLYGMNGSVNLFLKSILKTEKVPLNFLYSFWGIVIIQGFYNFPLVMTGIADVWKKLDTSEEKAARLLGSSKLKTFFTVTVPKLFPAIISSLIPVFIFSYFSFVIVLLFGKIGKSTLEVAVYHSAKNLLDFKSARSLALLETLSLLFFLSIFRSLEKKSASYKNSLSQNESDAKKIDKKELVILFLLLIPVFFFFILPLLSVFIKALKGSFFVLKSKVFYRALINTIITGLFTSFFSTTAGLFSSLAIYRLDTKKKIFFKNLFMIPLCVSSVILGFGMTELFHETNPLILILCQSSLYWPFAFTLIFSSLEKTEKEIFNSAILLSNPQRAVRQVMLSYAKNGIYSALAFTFTMSAGDSVLPLILSIRDFDTLALFTFRLASSYRIKEACFSGIIMTFICSLSFAAETAFKKKYMIKK